MFNVFPHAPVRHWVLTLPTHLRFNLGFYHVLFAGVLGCFVEAIFHHLRSKARRILGLPKDTVFYPGAISVPHRVSMDLSANFHFHCIMIDGVYVQETPGGPVTFYAIPELTAVEIADVAWDACRRTRDLLKQHGYWEDSSALPETKTVRGTLSLGAQRRVVTYGGHSFNVFAGDCINREDRNELRNLVLYLLSPPFTENQITIHPDGRVQLRLKRQAWNGATDAWFSPHEFLEALVHLVPHPRSHGIRYHGVLARRAKLRNLVVPERKKRPGPRFDPHIHEIESASDREARVALYVRAYCEDFLRCPECLGKFELVALDTKSIRYRNPRWTKPDTPQGPAAEPVQNETREEASNPDQERSKAKTSR
jgi:hypothetical protein